MSKILALPFRNNAILSKDTLANTFLQLVGLAPLRKKLEPKDVIQVNQDANGKVLEMIPKPSKNVGNDDALFHLSENANTVPGKAMKMVQTIKQVLDTNSELIGKLKSISDDNYEDHDMFSTSARRRFIIDDSIIVVKYHSLTAKKTNKANSMNDIENMATKHVDNIAEDRIHRALAAFQTQTEGPNTNSTGGFCSQNLRALLKRQVQLWQQAQGRLERSLLHRMCHGRTPVGRSNLQKTKLLEWETSWGKERVTKIILKKRKGLF